MRIEDASLPVKLILDLRHLHSGRGEVSGTFHCSRSAITLPYKSLLAAFGLRPHIIQTWKLPADPLFTGKVRDVVGLYMSPPENALVLCVDEKTQIQALDRTAPCLPMLPATRPG